LLCRHVAVQELGVSSVPHERDANTRLLAEPLPHAMPRLASADSDQCAIASMMKPGDSATSVL
jgi:hypothetical protein